MRFLLLGESFSSVQTGLEALGASVDVTSDESEALAKLTSSHYDALLLDDAHASLCSSLLKEGTETFVIVLTSRTDLETRRLYLDEGADDCIRAPHSAEEILASVRAMARRSCATSHAIITHEGLLFDPRNRVVKRDGRELLLTPKEYALLECLLHRRGSVVSLEEMNEIVWQGSVAEDEKTIESHILSLRRKVDRHDRVSVIHVVQGKGYTICSARNLQPSSFPRRRESMSRDKQPLQNPLPFDKLMA